MRLARLEKNDSTFHLEYVIEFCWVSPRSPLHHKLFIIDMKATVGTMSFAPMAASSRIDRGMFTCQKLSHFGHISGLLFRGLTLIKRLNLEIFDTGNVI